MPQSFVLVTVHSLYLFVQQTGRRFTMTASNPKYAGPTTVVFDGAPVIGERPFVYRVDGPRAGLYLQLSKVLDIVYSEGQQ